MRRAGSCGAGSAQSFDTTLLTNPLTIAAPPRSPLAQRAGNEVDTRGAVIKQGCPVVS
jgi:hypothetical protein